ncbi:MAG: peptidoglycan editing factor PgeF [Deltaproteobacteria bacterium]|nr:peptidoglycan editing factor PgeF [Deltaproteobacteria bacterium]
MRSKGEIKYISSPLLERDGIAHAFLSRTGGVSSAPFDTLNFDARDSDTAGNIAVNKGLISKAFGINADEITTVNQVHGNSVLVLDGTGGGSKADADAIVTRLKGIPIGMLTADCLPILLHDPVNNCIGAVHAGWKGTAKWIVKEAIASMRSEFNSRPADIIAALGPYIGPCCYSVREDVAVEFRKTFKDTSSFIEKDGDGFKLDIGLANVKELLTLGVKKENISFEPVCTSCNSSLFFSYRKDNGRTGRQLSFITLT